MNDFSNITTPRNSIPARRVSQRALLPSAVKSRNLGNFIFKAAKSTATAAIANGEQLVLESVLTQNSGYPIFAIPFISMYVGSVAAANQLPGGSSIDESQWQFTQARMNQEDWETAGYPTDSEYATIYVRNISAGSVSIVFVVEWKYLCSREGAT